MSKRQLGIPLVTLLIVIAAFLPLVAQERRSRQRIAYTGMIMHGAMGISQRPRTTGQPGDTLILRSSAKAHEMIEAGAYLYCRSLDANDQPTSQWFGVPVSRWGIEHGYQSQSKKTVCAAIRFTNPAVEDVEYDFTLFLPYEAIRLTSGRYELRYLLQVRVNGQLVDSFWTNDVQLGEVKPSGSVRPGIAFCRAQHGPCLTHFRLLGTSDPELEPVSEGYGPTSEPAIAPAPAQAPTPMELPAPRR